MQTYNADDHIVDVVIGSAYQVVKYVAANMEMLIQLSNSIETLQQYLSDIEDVLANKEAILNVHTHINELVAISANMSSLLNVNNNISALLSIANNLSAILAVPGSIAAMDCKASVRLASTVNLSLSGLLTVDGVATVAGDRVLVKNQTVPANNGIYVVGAGLWSRAGDASGANVSTNNVVMVDAGAVNAGKMFRLSTIGAIVSGTTDQTWTEFAPDSYLNGDGTGVSLVGTKTGASLGVKSIKAGANITVTDDAAGSLVIAATGGSGGVANVGDVIDAILTDTNGILFDSEGHILYEETV